MSTNHLPEPWCYRRSSDGRYYEIGPKNVRADASREQIVRMVQGIANARRITACVNACAGIPTAALEAGGVAKLDEAKLRNEG